MSELFLGIDVGAETVRLVAVEVESQQLVVRHRAQREHHKQPHAVLDELVRELDWRRVAGVAATGRLGRVVRSAQVPTKAAMRRGLRTLHPELPDATLISIGAHGFSVLESSALGQEHYQQNSRCSQGTGNFLGQLVARFGLTIEEASRLCDAELEPAALSGRCPVILKTDMTHLANKGESQSRILAGLYDAVCENVVTLVRPRLAPRSVVLIGGVARSARIRRTIGDWLAERGLQLVDPAADDAVLEALGAAVHAREMGAESRPVARDELLVTTTGTDLEHVPGLQAAMSGVKRVPRPLDAVSWDAPRDVILGLDIGSTGSKAVAVDATTGDPLWEAYLNTEGAPVRAAQSLVERWCGETIGAKVLGFGVTGSGREVVGSLLRTCYGDDRVFVLNEIAAHARGAISIDPEVDTIFEIGGQDAKYIRLEEGRVIDAAMNEACSAGTGSFIAEQGAKLEGVGVDPVTLGRVALEAPSGISLGQHCSVFMAEVIDEAITQGVERSAIVAGLYDSVIQNYLNRVKGTRSIGNRIFCQGMPFSSDALAAAVARQTGRTVVVPPHPGTIGALGIALLVRDEKIADLRPSDGLNVQRFLSARLKQKETFVCRSTKGCGGGGNKCRIDRLTTEVEGAEQRFVWGGSCSLYDRGAARAKLPDRAPDPFREREALVDAALAEVKTIPNAPVVALTDEFSLKGHLPLVAAFLGRLGFAVHVARHGGGAQLKRGIEAARIPYCAPLQLFHGVVFDLVERGADYLLLPMVKSLPRAAEGDRGALCPMVLGAPDLVVGVLPAGAPRVLRPVIEFDDQGYRGGVFVECLRRLAQELGAEAEFEPALRDAVAAQERFEQECVGIGRRALEFCAEQDVVAVVVHGRPYTIYNDVLNSNVPSLLRGLGAVAIPLDCFPVDVSTAALPNQYWGYTQRNLRAAYEVRRRPGVYSVFCSNYACGPDSFGLHFFAYAMRGKPFAIVETDGHSGDAGTKTRMEAFLYCVDADLRSGASQNNLAVDFAEVDNRGVDWLETKRRQARVFIPRMSENAEIAAAALRSEGYRAEALPFSTREDVRLGRQHTSGKECVPMMLTLGTMLNRVRALPDPTEKVTFFMPTTHGPCRFGVYHSLHKLTLERLGMADRVDIVSPNETDYFDGMSADFSAKLWVGFAAHDLLQSMLYDVRPVERKRGAANEIFQRYRRELIELMERPSRGSLIGALAQLASGMWGARDLVSRAAAEFGELKERTREVPTVAVVGEIYVRLDPFANDFVVDKLEERGLRVRFAPFIEWLEYTTLLGERRVAAGQPIAGDDPIETSLKGLIQRVSLQVLWDICAEELRWGERGRVEDSLEAAAPYVHPHLEGEAVLTLGGPLHEFRAGLIHGVVIVGPHECMPCKIAEAQYGKIAEDSPLPYLSIPLNGDPLDTELLDRFAFDVRESYRGLRHTTLPVLDGPESRRTRCSGECGARLEGLSASDSSAE